MEITGNAAVNAETAAVSQASSVSKTEPVRTELDTVQEPKPAQAQESEAQVQEITREDVEEMVDALKEMTATLQTKMDFSINEGTNSLVVKVLEQDTEKVIKQFPPEELLELQEKMQDLTGFLFSTDA